MWYSDIMYPVGHPCAGMPYQEDMTDAEYQDLIHRYKELHKKMNSRRFCYWKIEKPREQRQRLNKEIDQKKKNMGCLEF